MIIRVIPIIANGHIDIIPAWGRSAYLVCALLMTFLFSQAKHTCNVAMRDYYNAVMLAEEGRSEWHTVLLKVSHSPSQRYISTSWQYAQ